MPWLAKVTLTIGFIMLSLSIINAYISPAITPSFQRAEVLAGLTSICLISLSLAWKELKVKSQEVTLFKEHQGFYYCDNLSNDLTNEMAWGSQMILTATAASTIFSLERSSLLAN